MAPRKDSDARNAAMAKELKAATERKRIKIAKARASAAFSMAQAAKRLFGGGR